MSKILYIGGFELPDKNAAAQRVVGNAKALAELGYEVIFVGLKRGKINKGESFYYNGFKCYEFSYPGSFGAWIKYLSDISDIKHILELEGNVEKIIAYNYPSLALDKLRKLKTKIYADCTEWYEPQGNIIYKTLKGLDVYYRMNIVHNKLDGIIVISDFLENFYKDKIHTINIPPLVDINEAKWGKSERKLDHITLTYSGSPGTGKKDRLDKVIELVEKVKSVSDLDVRLNVVGLKEEEFLESFKIKHVNSRIVKFWGRLSHTSSLEIIKKSHFFVFFRDNNLTNSAGFPTKFVEAVSLGVPIITNSSSNIKSYFDKNPNLGILTDFSDESSSKVINYINNYYKKQDNLLFNDESFHFANYVNIFNNFLSSK